MAFCSKCGTQISEGSAFCQNCGAPAPGAAATAPPAAQATAQPVQTVTAFKTNSFAIISLIAGIVSLFFSFYFIIAIVAIIFGVLALSQIKKNPAQKGKGLAIAGIILGAGGVIITIIGIIVLGSLLSAFF